MAAPGWPEAFGDAKWRCLASYRPVVFVEGIFVGAASVGAPFVGPLRVPWTEPRWVPVFGPVFGPVFVVAWSEPWLGPWLGP